MSEQYILNKSRNKIIEVVNSIRIRPEFYKKQLYKKRLHRCNSESPLIIKHFWFTSKTISYWDRISNFKMNKNVFEMEMIQLIELYNDEIAKLLDDNSAKIKLAPSAIIEDYDIIIEVN